MVSGRWRVDSGDQQGISGSEGGPKGHPDEGICEASPIGASLLPDIRPILRTDSCQAGGLNFLSATDVMTGLHAANAVLAALERRHISGKGQHIDFVLLDVQIAALANQAANFLVGVQVPSGTKAPRQCSSQYRAVPGFPDGGRPYDRGGRERQSVLESLRRARSSRLGE